MASVTNAHLDPPVDDVANVILNGTYTITGDSFDIASAQPYGEIAKLVGANDVSIVGGEVHSLITNFATNSSFVRPFTKTIAKSALNLTAGVDKVSLLVKLTPHPPAVFTKHSSPVGSF